jgi:hypothetical protein
MGDFGIEWYTPIQPILPQFIVDYISQSLSLCIDWLDG